MTSVNKNFSNQVRFIALPMLALILLSFSSMASDPLPGSRSIFVANHAEVMHDPKTFLAVRLRKCSCAGSNVFIDAENFSLCKCWVDTTHSDQPAIQGSPIALLSLFRDNQGSNPFIHCTGEGNIPILNIVSPTALLNILKASGYDDLVELSTGEKAVSVHDYLVLLSKKKIPVGNIADASNFDDISMLYHFYFHDLLNHLPLWIFAPPCYRSTIATRAQLFINVFEHVTCPRKFDPNGSRI